MLRFRRVAILAVAAFFPTETNDVQAKPRCSKVVAELMAKTTNEFAEQVVVEHDNEHAIVFKSERNLNCRGSFFSAGMAYGYSSWRAVFEKQNKRTTYTHGFFTGYKQKGFPDTVQIAYRDLKFTAKPLLMGELGRNGRIFGIDLDEQQVAALAGSFDARQDDTTTNKLATIHLLENGVFLGFGTSMLLDELAGFHRVVVARHQVEEGNASQSK